MFEALRLMFSENWQWRQQVWNLALMDIRKTCRGAVLGWIWLFVKPLTYVLVFWFALEMGLRASDSVGDYPYILWLCAGLLPWFYMQDMLNVGSNVYTRYPFLVNRIHFPLSSISTFYSLSQFFINLMLFAIMLILCVVTGEGISIYLIQLPFILIAMWVFFTFFSIMTSPLSALSKDFNNLLKAFTTPVFWLSGIIFNVHGLGIPFIETILAFNPVTFFATACRAALCDQYWIWEKPEMLLPFLLVFALTFLGALYCYHRLRREVADVL